MSKTLSKRQGFDTNRGRAEKGLVVDGFWKGVLKDFVSVGIVFGLIFIMVLIIGGLLLVLNIIKEEIASIIIILGTLFFVIFIPFIIIIGIFLDRLFFKRAKGRSYGFFTSREIEPAFFTSKYRLQFIGQKFFILIIMVFLAIICAPMVGILGITRDSTILFSPIILPLFVIAIGGPAIAWVTFVYAFDPYEPEPKVFIILGIFWGMLSTFPSLFLNTFNASWMGDLGAAVISAPIFEELFKSLGFFFIFSQIRDETDGLLYGSAFGAGFSLLENFVYGSRVLLEFEEGGGIVFIFLITIRSIFNILGHMFGPGVIGFLIGAGKQWFSIDQVNRKNEPKKVLIFYLIVLPVLVISGYLVAILNHAFWNLIASLGILAFVFISIPLGMFQWIFFLGLVLFSFILSTLRYNKKLADHRRRNPF